MNCSNCGHSISDESLGFCVECGALFDVPEGGSEDYTGGDYTWDAPPPSAFERADQALSKVLGPIKDVAGQVGAVFQEVLEAPRLRSHLPGGSLTLLGLGLVGVALVLSVIPFVPGLGSFGSGVMLLGGMWVAVNEWRELSLRPLPPALENLPEETRHPGIAQAFALLTCTQAVLMLGYGLISLVWLLAAVALGYEQGRRFFADPPEDTPDMNEGLPGLRLHRWIVVGVVICSFALLFPWERGNMHTLGASGADQPLSTLTQLTLLLLACFALRYRGLSALHPLVLILMGVWLTMWFFLMMSIYTVGPWLFLPGLLVLDVIIVLHLVRLRRGGESVEQETASDMDLPG